MQVEILGNVQFAGETLPKFWQKVSCPKSSLVKEDIVLRSEPGIGVMPRSPQDSSRVLGNSGRVLSASLGSALDTLFRRSIPVEHLDQPSIKEIEPIDSMQIDEDPSWQDPIIDYFVNGNLPTDKSEARKVQQKAVRYYMQSDKLIRKSYSGPHLICIKYPQTLEVLCKIQDGECGNHS
ncbi:unnamed protein product [Prunus armeniaca]